MKYYDFLPDKIHDNDWILINSVIPVLTQVKAVFPDGSVATNVHPQLGPILISPVYFSKSYKINTDLSLVEGATIGVAKVTEPDIIIPRRIDAIINRAFIVFAPDRKFKELTGTAHSFNVFFRDHKVYQYNP